MSSDWDIDIEGDEELEDTLERLERNAPDALGAALYARAQPMMTTAKKKTPVDTGSLKQSGFVGSPIRDLKGVAVPFGFGKEYAFWVHEMPGTLMGEPRSESPDPIQGTGRGKHWDPQGQAEPQFLRKALDEHASDFLRDVADMAEEWAESGGRNLPPRDQRHPTDGDG